MGSFKNASDSNNTVAKYSQTDTHIHQEHIDPMLIILHTVASTSKRSKGQKVKVKK